MRFFLRQNDKVRVHSSLSEIEDSTKSNAFASIISLILKEPANFICERKIFSIISRKSLRFFAFKKEITSHNNNKTNFLKIKIMAKLNPYLNFDGTAEKAFTFYKSVFGGEFVGEIHKMGNAPGTENLSDEEKNRVMHIALPIGGDLLMASDIVPSFGQKLTVGNNNYVSIFPDSREDADRIFKGLSEGGNIEMPLEDQFWGDYFGSFQDQFGVHWMINYNEEYTK